MSLLFGLLGRLGFNRGNALVVLVVKLRSLIVPVNEGCKGEFTPRYTDTIFAKQFRQSRSFNDILLIHGSSSFGDSSLECCEVAIGERPRIVNREDNLFLGNKHNLIGELGLYVLSPLKV